jgi:hypothetical protein
LGVNKPKGINRIAIIGYGYPCPSEIVLNLNKLHYLFTPGNVLAI